jgi:cytochrome oxidase assembly protein ShyY1
MKLKSIYIDFLEKISHDKQAGLQIMYHGAQWDIHNFHLKYVLIWYKSYVDLLIGNYMFK